MLGLFGIIFLVAVVLTFVFSVFALFIGMFFPHWVWLNQNTASEIKVFFFVLSLFRVIRITRSKH